MQFRQYTKIHRLGNEENDGILVGKCYIQEKIDGANTSIYLRPDGEVECTSRTRVLDGGFNGFYDYVQSHKGIQNALTENPGVRLYGEWLVRHSIDYNELAYKEFYLFDLDTSDDEEKREWKTQDEVKEFGDKYGIKTADIFCVLENPTVEQIKEYVGKTSLGKEGEGVVIKNYDFVNKFGNRVYAKITTDNFKEKNAITFGGNNKHAETYWEIYVVNKYMTLARVQKIMHKMQPTIDKRLDMEHTSMIGGVAYNDMITEEIWEIQKKVPSISFTNLRRLATKKAITIYHEIIRGSISVAHQKND